MVCGVWNPEQLQLDVVLLAAWKAKDKHQTDNGTARQKERRPIEKCPSSGVLNNGVHQAVEGCADGGESDEVEEDEEIKSQVQRRLVRLTPEV
mmetsp:Transcript_57153/g.134528  ORF Transcript_57153/g.134528 Transcript_57153/m.134528 type:complete len:93 (-) Transcript_57153:246-524(-)